MRNATILVVNLRGVATETIKNIVLAGIGKLIMWDCEDVAAEDLGVGFFFRDGDVGKKVRFFPLLLLLTSLTASGFKFEPPPLIFGLGLCFLSPPLLYLHRHAEAHGYNFFGFIARRCGKGSYRKPQPARCGRDHDVSICARTGKVRGVGTGRGSGVYNRL
jgi:hypothetical protein